MGADALCRYFCNGEELSLGYILANNGYDVWAGNNRGNRFSRAHKTLDASDPKYWDFSLDHQAKYDVPSSLKVIVEVSGIS